LVTSTGKATLINVDVPGFHWRLRMKLSNVLEFYQETFAQKDRTLVQRAQQRFRHSS